MTPAKRWPHKANEHRLESLSQAHEIGDILTEAKSALRRRNLDLCLVLIAQAQTKAMLIHTLLKNVPRGDALDDHAADHPDAG
jgi:hypothetical protein